MSQHDFNIANQLFPATRADLNNSLVALASNSSGDAEPTTTYANQWWYETDSNTLKLRNEANTAWVPICILDQGNNNVLSITTQGLTLGATTITASGTEINQLDDITRGSLIYGNASGVTSRLAKGGAGTVLTSDGTDISWAAAGSGFLPLSGGTMTGNLALGDNVKATFGAGSDLEVFHNGSNSVIKDVGTGGLSLSSNGYAVLCYDNANANPMAEFLTGSGTKLYHNGNLKFEVTGAGVAITGAATVGGAAVKVAGKESIYVPAAAMYPSTTNGSSGLEQVETTALRPDLKVLDFSDGADKFAQFTVAFPKSWNEGTVTFQPFWTVTGTNTGTVAWQLAAVAITNDESINTAFGTQVSTTALAFSGTSNDLMVSAESGAVTIAGSPAANDMCFFQINRDISADTQSGAARLVGIKLFFTTDAANDA